MVTIFLWQHPCDTLLWQYRWHIVKIFTQRWHHSHLAELFLSSSSSSFFLWESSSSSSSQRSKNCSRASNQFLNTANSVIIWRLQWRDCQDYHHNHYNSWRDEPDHHHHHLIFTIHILQCTAEIACAMQNVWTVIRINFTVFSSQYWPSQGTT